MAKYVNISMNVFAIVNVATTQRRRYYTNIPMNVYFVIIALMVQRRRCYINIPMNEFVIANVATMQRRMCYASIPMNEFCNINALMVQRCKRCTSDSPGLTSESEVYPGSFAVNGNNAVGVVPFILRHFITAFHAENVQHLRR